MSTLSILIVLPLLIIFSYLFELIAKKTKFPAVILLMLTGALVRAGTTYYGIKDFAFLDNLIPVLGTIGLILIVLEGALELDITLEKLPLILKGFIASAVILILNIVVLTSLFEFFGMAYEAAVIYAIPLSIISSAIAIPSSKGLVAYEKEFVVYESTFSDILGIMIFNYAIRQFETNQTLISGESLLNLGLQILGVILISLLITYCLFQLLQKIEHHVKFFLILALLILVYALGKIFHLPALVPIFIFGLFLSNVKLLLPKFMKKQLDLASTEKGLHEFHVLTAESTFIVKTFFFLFFGFSIDLTEFTSIEPFIYGLLIYGLMWGIRYIYFTLTSFRLKPSALVFISPRGLISILLFLQIVDISFLNNTSTVVDERVLLVIILSSMVIMTLGTMTQTQGKEEEEEETDIETTLFEEQTEENDPDEDKNSSEEIV